MGDIYLLFSCNEWKEHSSMRLVAATTDKDNLDKIVQNQIKENNMGYRGELKREALRIFNIYEDYNGLDYGYVQIVKDGEIQ